MRDDAPAPLAPARFRGALLGLAAGDAVGTTVEFQRPGSFRPLADMVGGGPFGLAPGSWTDDTSMALCLAASLVETGRFDPADQLDRYVRWQREGYMSSTGTCFDIGGTVSGALAAYLRTGETQPPLDEEQAANGSIMRLAPVPLRYAADIEAAIEHAAASSRTTHPAARPVDACRLLAALIVGALEGRPKEELLDPGYWRWGPLHPQIAAIAAGSYRKKEPPAIRGNGFVVHSLEAALWALHRTDGFREGALAAANLGDDADTTAAVYGQLAGALYGEDGIPPTWRERLAQRELIASLADALHAAATGAPVAVPSSAGPSRLPDHYCVEPGRLLAGEYPGSLDRAEAEAKLGALLDAGITAFVDLTEAGELRAYDRLLASIAAARGIRVCHHRHPVGDLDVPTTAQMAAALDRVDALLAAGETVYVHCWGGVGRTGTLVACHLIRRGTPPREAIGRLAGLRTTSAKRGRPAPETPAQRAFVEGWGEAAAGRVPAADAGFHDIATYAQTLPDGYGVLGGPAVLGMLSDGLRTWFEEHSALPDDLTLLAARLALFYEVRRARHSDEVPEGARRRYVEALLARIRAEGLRVRG